MVTINDKVYVLCAVCKIPSIEEYGYVPIIDVSNDLSSVYLSASTDIISAQLKYTDTISALHKAGATPLIVPLTLDGFKTLSEFINDNAAIAINAFKDVMRHFIDIFSIFELTEVNTTLTAALYSAIISDNAPAFITKDLDVIEGDDIDIKNCISIGMERFTELSNQMQDEKEAQKILGALLLSSGSEELCQMIEKKSEFSDLYDFKESLEDSDDENDND